MFLKYLCKCQQGLRLKPFGYSQKWFLGQKYSLWIILVMTGLMPLVFFFRGNLRETALPLFPSGRDPEWEWRGVILIGAVVFKKAKSVGAHSKRLRQSTSKLCSDATCLVLFETFDSWIVLQSNFWPQIANSFFSLTGLTFDVITHIPTVSGVCLSWCACMWQLRQTYFKHNCSYYFPALGAISAPLSVSALRKWSHKAPE